MRRQRQKLCVLSGLLTSCGGNGNKFPSLLTSCGGAGDLSSSNARLTTAMAKKLYAWLDGMGLGSSLVLRAAKCCDDLKTPIGLVPTQVRILSSALNFMIQKATFAAGCFWHVEEAFRKAKGVISTTVGYTGGKTKNPPYEQVCSHKTGHAEAVEVAFDSNKVSYEKLLDIFWSIHNPTQMNRQGFDIGTQYRSAVFYRNEKQKEAAIKSRDKLQKSEKYKNKNIVTEIAPASEFYRAEEYHQRCFEKKGVFKCG